jgi:hypothetical protein
VALRQQPLEQVEQVVVETEQLERQMAMQEALILVVVVVALVITQMVQGHQAEQAAPA